MTFFRPALSGLTSTLGALALAAATLLAGCAQQATWNGVYRADTVGGSRTCLAAPVAPPDGQAVVVQMQVSSEGGWCGITTNHNGTPFDTYMMVTRPTHGTIFAHRVGNSTRVDYTPDAGYVGNDAFAVRMVPGNSVIEGAVAVTR